MGSAVMLGFLQDCLTIRSSCLWYLEHLSDFLWDFPFVPGPVPPRVPRLDINVSCPGLFPFAIQVRVFYSFLRAGGASDFGVSRFWNTFVHINSWAFVIQKPEMHISKSETQKVSVGIQKVSSLGGILVFPRFGISTWTLFWRLIVFLHLLAEDVDRAHGFWECNPLPQKLQGFILTYPTTLASRNPWFRPQHCIKSVVQSHS